MRYAVVAHRAAQINAEVVGGRHVLQVVPSPIVAESRASTKNMFFFSVLITAGEGSFCAGGGGVGLPPKAGSGLCGRVLLVVYKKIDIDTKNMLEPVAAAVMAPYSSSTYLLWTPIASQQSVSIYRAYRLESTAHVLYKVETGTPRGRPTHPLSPFVRLLYPSSHHGQSRPGSKQRTSKSEVNQKRLAVLDSCCTPALPHSSTPAGIFFYGHY